MTIYLDDTALADDVPVADAAEQRQSADDNAEETLASTSVVWLTFCSATPIRRM